MEIPHSKTPELASQHEIDVVGLEAITALGALDRLRTQMIRQVVGEDVYFSIQSEGIDKLVDADADDDLRYQVALSERDESISYLNDLIERDAVSEEVEKVLMSPYAMFGMPDHMRLIFSTYMATDMITESDEEKAYLGTLLRIFNKIDKDIKDSEAWGKAAEEIVSPKIQQTFGEVYGKRCVNMWASYHPLNDEAEKMGHTSASGKLSLQFRDTGFSEKAIGKMISANQAVDDYAHKKLIPVLRAQTSAFNYRLHSARMNVEAKRSESIGMYVHNGAVLIGPSPLRTKQEVIHAQEAVDLTNTVIEKLKADLDPDQQSQI